MVKSSRVPVQVLGVKTEGPGGNRNLTKRPTEITNPVPRELIETETSTKENALSGPRPLAHMWPVGCLVFIWGGFFSNMPAFGSLAPGRAALPGIRR